MNFFFGQMIRKIKTRNLPLPPPFFSSRSRYRYAFIKINILNGVKNFRAFVHGSLESLSPRNQAHAARAFVDDGGFYGFRLVACARGSAARVNQPRASHVAIQYLVTA